MPKFHVGYKWTEKQIATRLSNVKKIQNRPTQQRAAKARIEYEHGEVDKLKADGFEVFFPTSVCDRVAVKEGQARCSSSNSKNRSKNFVRRS